MEIKQVVPNHIKLKYRLFLLFIHAMNGSFQRKQEECLEGNREGRKALFSSVNWYNTVRLSAFH